MIRPGTANDILKVSRLWLQMVTELAPELTPNVEWWRAHALNFLKNGAYHFFVADLGGKLVGFLDYFIFPEPSTGKWHGVGQHLFVLPEHRRTGIGGLLYRSTVKDMMKKGCTVQELFCFESELPGWIKKGYKPKRTLVRKEV